MVKTLTDQKAKQKQQRILIADDQSINLSILLQTLGPEYQISIATNGSRALELARSKPRPDLILLDVVMPEMDGYEVLRRLKADRETQDIPVIIITSLTRDHDEQKGFELGASDFITKPFNPNVVRERVKTKLNLKLYQDHLESLVENRTREIQELNGLLSSIIDSMNEAIVTIETNGTISFANANMEKLIQSKAELLIGKSPESFLEPDTAEEFSMLFSEIIEQGTIFTREDVRLKTANQRERKLVNIRIIPRMAGDSIIGAVGFIEDVTRQTELQEQLIQASKMVTLGELATGIAHEINQPLNVIRLASEMMESELENDELDREFLTERSRKILGMVDRASKIISHLRNFGRRSELSFTCINPNEPVENALELFKEKCRLHSIELAIDLTNTEEQVKGDPNKLEQVYINMIANAYDAIEEARQDFPDKQFKIQVTSRADPAEQQFVVSVSNNGPPIPEDVQASIFEAFFTTKVAGKGTGLGLSISSGIVDSHRGKIQLVSNQEKTEFSISLPVLQPEDTHVEQTTGAAH